MNARISHEEALQRGVDGFFHPSSEAQICALIHQANRQGTCIRVRGSAHSVASAIYTDGRGASSNSYDVLLDRYIGIDFDDEKMQVTVQGGCHLGRDPRDHTGTSTWDNSLLLQLERRGWALPDLGGVSHQTVAGFIATGSAGGSVQRAIGDSILALRIVDGTGEVRVLRRGIDDEFDAAACSMGLLGIVLDVTFQCESRYDVVGTEAITSATHAPFAVGAASPGVAVSEFLRNNEYCRLLWWPQKGVDRTVVWKARRMGDGDYGEVRGMKGALRPKAYRALGSDIRSPRLARGASVLAQAVGGGFYGGVSLVRRGLRRLEKASPRLEILRRIARPGYEHLLLPWVLRRFVPADPEPDAAQEFHDSWFRALPMDNQMVEGLMPTSFTELWVDLEDGPQTLELLRSYFERHGLSATGDYVFEFYACSKSQFWMHPGYGRDSFRINIFWFKRNRENASEFFAQFWRLLAGLNYRLHWGKHLPNDPELGCDYLARNYPRWDDFLALRQKRDPKNIFLNSHWRRALKIA